MSRFAMIAATTLLLATAMPASAQAPGFGVLFGDEESDFFPDYPERITCMTERQVRDEVAAMGYSDISLNVAMEKHIQVRASREGTVYLIDFNFCTGRVVNTMPLRRAQ
ncbi:hypothetical protein SAMN05428969_2877 [Devosia sp. YR412]|uniref:hypothetical protein n=1 Tax=Devosia sp. YR412 TaxID=1881030 RepID=UPI0008D746D9|nr:hypothetical protein [Devosia sp. YR412]SEQ38940.1 hypothetical protein SAMN05428969_2877 [Devosia sp. YR412]